MDQMSQTTAEAKGEDLDPVKHVYGLLHLPQVIRCCLFQGSNVVAQCYMMLCPCIYMVSSNIVT